MNAQPQLKIVDDGRAPPHMITVPADSYVVTPDRLREFDPIEHDVKQGRRWLRMLIADETHAEQHPIKRPTPRPHTVEFATPEDEAEVVALILEDTSRQVPGWVQLDAGRILEHVQLGTQRRGGIVGVIKEDGHVVGTIVLVNLQPAFSLMYYIQEIFHVVHRNHRRSNHARDLVNFAKWCSDEMTREFGYPVNLHYVVTAEPNAWNWRKKIWFFRRLLMQCGATFVYPCVRK